ncbi:MAG: tetratricopeptide repeat protein [Magnetococcales bacterium]|nr:tetratricopeptide repeat protein [Magnetococcales bacterium]
MESFSHGILEQFCHVIGAYTGFVIPEHDLPHLREKLVRRVQLSQSGTEARYLALLTSEGAASEQEWRALVLELTTGESYFFRDAGQMRLLREVIFPELLALRAPSRSLRVWSAGCSSGEEPYSLAILIASALAAAGGVVARDSLPPAANGWNVLIKGTDINEQALQQAQEGRYGRWAFRGVGEEVQQSYFVPDGRYPGEWRLQPGLQEMVRFAKLNLIKDLFPDPRQDLYDLDLIVCRNVFIYFHYDAIAGIMARFAACLRPGGYILTGHAEVQQPVSQLVASGSLPLEVRQFPDSVIFYRPLEERASAGRRGLGREGVSVRSPSAGGTEGPLPSPVGWQVKKPVPVVPPAPPAPPVKRQKSAEQRLQEAQAQLEQGHYGAAIRLAESLREALPLSGELCLLLARCHANLGEQGKAEGYCREALRHRPFVAEPHFLLATLVQDRGDVEQAKDLLKKTLYLDHGHVAAYLHLATLYQEEGVLERARQMRLGALDVLHGLPAESRVPHYEEWTARALVQQLEKLLGESAASVRSA